MADTILDFFFGGKALKKAAEQGAPDPKAKPKSEPAYSPAEMRRMTEEHARKQLEREKREKAKPKDDGKARGYNWRNRHGLKQVEVPGLG